MLMQELGRIIQEDPNLCAMAMVDKRKYIINKWNASHSEPIDEDAVALFLCDENRGNLTDEQRAFAKERCAVPSVSLRRDDAPASGVRPSGILPDFPASVRYPLRQRDPPLQRPVRRCVPSLRAG